MNRTVSIHLNGMLFNLEEAAYQNLADYLAGIRSYFKHTDGREEIIADVEGRIAELFSERLKNKQVILETEVAEIIGLLGQPEAFADDAAENEQPENVRAEDYAEPRRLFRDPDDGVIAGVCRGIGHYFGIDAVWLRIAFLIAFFFAGSGVILYLILWIAMPKARTRSEKLQMRGEPVNLDTLERGFKREMDSLRQKHGPDGKGANGAGSRSQIIGFVTELAINFGKAIGHFFAWLGRFIGFVFLMAGLLGFFLWLMVVLGNADTITINGNLLNGHSIGTMFGLVFSHPWQAQVFSIGLALLVLAPVLGIFFSGVRLIFPKRFSYRWTGAISGGLFIIGMLTCIVCGAFVIRDFNTQGKIILPVALAPFSTDTIHVAANKNTAISLKRTLRFDDWQVYANDNEKYIMGKIQLKIEKAEVDKPVLQVLLEARGKNKREAIENAEGLKYYVKQKGDSLFFNPWFNLGNDSRWRGQEVEFRLKVPSRTHFRFDQTMVQYIKDMYVPFRHETEPVESWLWKPGTDKMDCLNCPEYE